MRKIGPRAAIGFHKLKSDVGLGFTMGQLADAVES
jgi:hypothetical protein